MKKTKLYTTIGIVTAFSFVISTVSVLANDINQTGSEYTQSQNIEDNACDSIALNISCTNL